jgi:hypothetical protein
MRRLARSVVVFIKDPSDAASRHRFWLTRDYLPEAAGRPSLEEQGRASGRCPFRGTAQTVFEAYRRRPWAYLEEHVRRAMSVWTRAGPQAEQRAVHRLRDDLASGWWIERNRDLVALDAAELGLRLLVA